MMHENEILKLAHTIAEQAHEHQTRRDGSPYINHPKRVAELVYSYKGFSHERTSLVCAALLHDTIEDTAVTYYNLVDRFGHLIASLVLELTTNPEMKNGVGDKGKYLAFKCKHMTSWALVIKLCDRLDNLRDMQHCTEKFQQRYILETQTILGYIKENRELTSTHQAIIKDIEQELYQAASRLLTEQSKRSALNAEQQISME